MAQYWNYHGKNKKGQDLYMLYAYKDGKRKYRQWIAPEGYSTKALERALNKAALEFAAEVHEGKVLTKKEAKAQAEQQAAETDKLYTVERYAKAIYMPKKEAVCSANYMATLERHLRLYIMPVLGNRRIDDIKSADITALILDMQRAGKGFGTVDEVYKLLHNLFKEAYIDDTISTNPMDKVEHPKRPKAERTRKDDKLKALTVEDTGRFLKMLEDEPLKWKAYAHLVLDTACRNGEAIGLKWESIDFNARTVRIENNVQYTGADRGTYCTTIKNGKARTNLITAETASLLQEMRKEQLDNRILTPWVFTQDARGDVMHPQTPYQWLTQFGRRNGFEKGKKDTLHPHKLRHTAISLMAQHGIDIATIAEIAGDNIETIQRVYIHTNENRKKEASELYHSILESQKSVAVLVAVDNPQNKIIQYAK